MECQGLSLYYYMQRKHLHCCLMAPVPQLALSIGVLSNYYAVGLLSLWSQMQSCSLLLTFQPTLYPPKRKQISKPHLSKVLDNLWSGICYSSPKSLCFKYIKSTKGGIAGITNQLLLPTLTHHFVSRPFWHPQIEISISCLPLFGLVQTHQEYKWKGNKLVGTEVGV